MSAPRASLATRAASVPLHPDKPTSSGFYDDHAVLSMPKQEQEAARAERRGAVLAVCARARDAADAVLLLRALGLIPDPGASWEPNAGYRQALKKRREPPGGGEM